MATSLTKPLSLPVPDLGLSEAEWLHLTHARPARDMNERWTASVEGDRLFLVRSGRHPIYEATFAVDEAGGRSLTGLKTEGDETVFNRTGFANAGAVAQLAIDVVRQVVARIL
jgi:hypothetical protein